MPYGPWPSARCGATACGGRRDGERSGAIRIHHIINSFATSGGAETLARRLHLALLGRGIESRLVGLSGDAPELPASVNFGSRSPYGPAAFLSLARHVARTVRAGDIVHAHLFPTVAYLVALRRSGILPRVRLVFTEHNTSNRRRDKRLGRTVDRAIYAGLDEVVAISEGTRAALADWMPAFAARIHVVHNGVPLRRAAPIPRPATGRPRIVSLGNLRYTKNYGLAIEAVGRLRNLDFTYEIAGEGPDRAVLTAQIKTLGLGDRVRLLGYVNEPYRLLEMADMFFIPSIIEGFGLAAVEAMDASLPIVAACVPGLADVIGEAPCGRLVAPRSVESMARGLSEVLQATPSEREAMGRAAFLRSRTFSEDAMISGYLERYRAGTTAP